MGVPATISALLAESRTLERSGDVAGALQRAREALEEARSRGEREAIAASLEAMAFIHFRTGGYVIAQSLIEEALTYAPPNTPAHADSLVLMGLCASETDNPDIAEALYHRAIDVCRLIGYHRSQVRALHNLSAGVYMPRGQFELSLATDEEAVRLARENNHPELAWAPLATMGTVCWITGQRDRAHAVAEELRRLASPVSLAEGFYYCLMGDLAQDEGLPGAAIAFYGRARSIAEATGDPGLGVLLRLGLSRCEQAAGNPAAGRAWADDALTIARRIGYGHLQGMSLIERGRAAWLLDGETAETDLRSAIEILTPLRAAYDLARASLFLAALVSQRRPVDGAAVWVSAARQITGGGYGFLLERERVLAFPLIATYLGSQDSKVAAVTATARGCLERVPPPPLRIFTLGRFDVSQAGRAIDKRAWSQRAGELFRLLLISPGRSLSRDEIIEALWPEMSFSSAQPLFHRATSSLRRVLEPELPEKFPSRYLEVAEGRVSLKLPPGSWIDHEAFERHVLEAKLEAAVDLYGGELFPADRYADWAAGPRERFVQLFLRTGLILANRQLASEHFEEALDICDHVLQIEPWQETAVLTAMKACLAMKDRVRGVHLYLRLERRLQEDLGIAPQEEIWRLYQLLKQ